jgi:glycosyltransferase involved in cell wall biosynthesis
MNQKLLSIVIPTYKRPLELARCLKSILDNLRILRPALREKLCLIIGDNGDSGLSKSVLDSFSILIDFVYIKRCNNIGMQKNVLDASRRATSEYIMWLTDDDLLFENPLEYLIDEIVANEKTGFFWGMLPTFDARDGRLFDVASKSFDVSVTLQPSKENALTYSPMGWALSRQIHRVAGLDFDKYLNLDNAYFPIMMAADQMLSFKSRYLSIPYILHSYYNIEYWEEWGADVAERKYRIFLDDLAILERSINCDGDPSLESILWNYQNKSILDFKKSDYFNVVNANIGFEKMMAVCESRLQYNFLAQDKIEKLKGKLFLDESN